MAWADSSAGMMPSVRQRSWKRRERLGVGDGAVLGALGDLEPRVLGADAGVVEAGGDRVRLDDLAVLVLQQVGASRRGARRAAPR